MSNNLLKACNVMTWKEWLERQKADHSSYRSLDDYYFYLFHSIYLAMFNYPKEIILSLIDELKNRYTGLVDMAKDLYPEDKSPKLFMEGKLDRAFTEHTKIYFDEMDLTSMCDQLLVFIHHEPETEEPESDGEKHQNNQIKKMLKIVVEDVDNYDVMSFQADDDEDLMYYIAQTLVLKITVAILKEKYKFGDTRKNLAEIYDYMIELLKGAIKDGMNDLFILAGFMHTLESYCEMSQHYILNLDLLFEKLLPYSSSGKIVQMIMTPNPFFQQKSPIKSPFKIYSAYMEECDKILSSDASASVKEVAKKLKSKISQREKKDLEKPYDILGPFPR